MGRAEDMQPAPQVELSCTPVPVTEAQAGRLCMELLAAMQDGRAVKDDFLAFLPMDTGTRVVVLAWSSGVLHEAKAETAEETAVPAVDNSEAFKKQLAKKMTGMKPGERPVGVVMKGADNVAKAKVIDKKGNIVAQPRRGSDSAESKAPRLHGKSCVGVGVGLRGAAVQALLLAREYAEADVKTAKYLKLDVVQNFVPVSGFRLYETPIFQPSVIGIAIPGKTNTFVLPPEVLSQCVKADNKFRPLNLPPVEEICLAKDGALQALEWMGVAGTNKPVPGAMFIETQCWFTNGVYTSPMFRGHRMPPALNAKLIERAGDLAADFLCRQIDRDGLFACTLPAWRCRDDGTENLGDYAEALHALLEWQELHPNTERDAAVRRGVDFLLKHLEAYPPVPGAKCLPESALLPQAKFATGEATGVHDTVLRSKLRTNALLAMALEKYLAKENYPAKLDGELAAVAAYLLAQQCSDGTFFAARAHPSGAIIPDLSAAKADAALAAIALVRIYGRTSHTRCLDAATRAAAILLPDTEVDAKQVVTRLNELSGSISVANELFTFSRDKSLLAKTDKMVVALLAVQSTVPVFPDGLGSISDSCAVPPVAVQLRGILTAAQLCQDSHRQPMANSLLASAHYGLMFQLQGQADEASTLFLPEGTQYGGAFRDSLATSEFSLTGQARCLSSLSAAACLLAARKETALPISDDLKRDYWAARSRLSVFPRCLPKKLHQAGGL